PGDDEAEAVQPARHLLLPVAEADGRGRRVRNRAEQTRDLAVDLLHEGRRLARAERHDDRMELLPAAGPGPDPESGSPCRVRHAPSPRGSGREIAGRGAAAPARAAEILRGWAAGAGRAARRIGGTGDWSRPDPARARCGGTARAPRGGR